MIVPMSKVSLIIPADKKQDALKKLRKLGTVHVEISEGSGEKLAELLKEASGVYTKLPEEFALPPQEINWEESSTQSLLRAFAELMDRRRMERANSIDKQEVVNDEFTIRRQLVKIRDRLRKKNTLRFEALFDEDASLF